MSVERPFVCRWREQMAETDLLATTKLVLHTIAINFDGSGKGAHPSLDTIARRASLDRSTVRRHLKLAAAWLEQRKGGGRGYATNYTAVVPQRTVDELDTMMRRDVSRQKPGRNGLAPAQERERCAPVCSPQREALRTGKGGTVPPQLDPKLDRERRARESDDDNHGLRIDDRGIAGPCFTLPWASIDHLATACRIARDEARDLAAAEAHEWAANHSTPDHPVAYLRAIFTSHRRSAATARATPGLMTSARSGGHPSLMMSQTPLTEARQVELVACFFEHGEWFPKLRDALGAPPGEPGCAIAGHIIEQAKQLVPFQRSNPSA
jgi:hypothetical protein